MKTKAKQILVIVGAIALFTGLFLDFKDITEVFTTHPDISGEWYFEFHTKESTFNDYVNSVTVYKMHILQNSESIQGNGETWKYNGAVLPYSEHIPIEMEGTVKEGAVYYKYKLNGSLRETTGSIKASFKGDELIGTFSGTGADVKGEFYGKRID